MTTNSSNIPGDVIYVTFRNINCCAINETTFRDVSKQNRSNSVHDEQPNNVICIMRDITRLRKMDVIVHVQTLQK